MKYLFSLLRACANRKKTATESSSHREQVGDEVRGGKIFPATLPLRDSVAMFCVMIVSLCLCTAAPAQQAIRVSPQSVNVYSQGATTIFLTYGNLGEYRPVETAWCGEITTAAPAVGFRCVPGTIYGTLPSRYDVSRRSGQGAYTDVVSVPASVARKAYQAAAAGESSEFFYVRRFVSSGNQPDQYVPVTMRLSGNGAGVPFSLTDVQLSFGAGPQKNEAAEAQVLFLQPGQKVQPVRAEIRYTGTGRLRGRWEIVRPGDPLPEARDLLSEASLPAEERGLQQRFTQIGRFNVFLPPGGRFTLPGPEVSRLPSQAAGQYLLLFRIEASGDSENISNLSAVNAGSGSVESGGAAGFPMPVLRYIVGAGSNAQAAGKVPFLALLPANNSSVTAARPIDFTWSELKAAAFYRLEIFSETGELLHSAIIAAPALNYRAPSFLKDKAGALSLRWQVIALGKDGQKIGETSRQVLHLNR